MLEFIVVEKAIMAEEESEPEQQCEQAGRERDCVLWRFSRSAGAGTGRRSGSHARSLAVCIRAYRGAVGCAPRFRVTRYLAAYGSQPSLENPRVSI